jgi:choline-sulfatase
MRPQPSRQISRRRAIQAGLGGIALAAGSRINLAAKQTRPNILMLMDDQHRADCLGIVGNTVIRTPNMDRIGHEGAVFRHAYSSVPSCIAARAGLLTGLSPWHHGLLGYSKSAEHYPNEMPRLLREAGFHATGIGKMHWSPQRTLHGFHETILDESGRVESPGFVSDYRKWFHEQAPDLDPDATDLGWNDYDARPYAVTERLHPTRWIGDRAVDHLQTYSHPEPFFLKVSFERPHSPYDPPQRFFDMYKDADLPPAVVGDWAERNACRGQKLPADTWRGDLGAAQVRRSRQGYYGSISFVDEQIGRIIETLEKRGLMENTLIVFFSDHGDMTGDHHLWRKSYAYEASAGVPMMIRWPDNLLSAKRGTFIDQPVELRDILPTFLDTAGTKYDPNRFDGRSLLELIRGSTKDWRPFIDLEHNICYSSDNHWNALTDGKTKYIFHAHDGRQQLFDLEHDPTETHDLAGDVAHAERLRNWRTRLIDHFHERGAPFIVRGDLAVRPKGTGVSPHYPSSASSGAAGN